jgi:hypothetical protein
LCNPLAQDLNRYGPVLLAVGSNDFVHVSTLTGIAEVRQGSEPFPSALDIRLHEIRIRFCEIDDSFN